MTAALQAHAVVVPKNPTPQQAAAFDAFLTFLAHQPEAITGTMPQLVSGDSRESVTVPPQIFDLLRQVAAALGRGDAVTVSALSREITTGEAAKMLGMSRPTLVRLLDTDQISSRRVGTHRRVLVRDVLEFRQQLLEHRRKNYEALMEECDALGMDE